VVAVGLALVVLALRGVAGCCCNSSKPSAATSVAEASPGSVHCRTNRSRRQNRRTPPEIVPSAIGRHVGEVETSEAEAGLLLWHQTLLRGGFSDDLVEKLPPFYRCAEVQTATMDTNLDGNDA